MKAYPLDLKTKFGVAVMSLAATMTVAILSMLFMIYVTDYSGIYSGVPGKAATVAASVLFAGRLWDAINDPFFGFIIEKTKPNRFGKYRMYILIGVILSVSMLILMFNIPKGLSDPMKVTWLYTCYFIWAIGFTLAQPIPLISALSSSSKVRSKLLTYARVTVVATSVFVAAGIPITQALGDNMGLMAVVLTLPLLLLSLVGISLVKENPNKAVSKKKSSVKLKDMIRIFRTNKPLGIVVLSRLFSGFAFTFIMGANLYYIKYAFGAENFALNSTIWGIFMVITSILGTIIASKINKMKNPVYTYVLLLAIQAAFLLLLFFINLISVPHIVLFFSLAAIALGAAGGSFIPTNLLYMECMNYNRWKNGKSMSAVINAANTFIEKTQSALSATVVGLVLVLVGYDVVKYENAITIPSELLKGLGIVMFLIPALVSVAGIVIMKWYPVDRELREEISNDESIK